MAAPENQNLRVLKKTFKKKNLKLLLQWPQRCPKRMKFKLLIFVIFILLTAWEKATHLIQLVVRALRSLRIKQRPRCDRIGPCWKGLGSFNPFDVWLEFLIETNIAHENDGFPISDYGIRFWICSVGDAWLKTGAVIPLRTVKIRKITCPVFTISQDP